MQALKYVSFDYEEPGEPDNFWHIFATDADEGSLEPNGGSLLMINGPYTPEMSAAVQRIAEAIDAAVAIAERETSEVRR